MDTIAFLLDHFFVHKDFLPPPDQVPGTLFTPLQILFCSAVAVGIGCACLRCARRSEAYQKRVFFVLWLLMAVPALLTSIPAYLANFLIPGADYMFFKMESFFFAPIGWATPDWLTLVLVYALYLLVHSAPYLPFFLANRKKTLVLQ